MTIAYWNIELNTTCPNKECQFGFDIISEYPDFWDARPINQIPNSDEQIEMTCPKCEHEFICKTTW